MCDVKDFYKNITKYEGILISSQVLYIKTNTNFT